jgi:tetratricopeptide (TPR) repeat protein
LYLERRQPEEAQRYFEDARRLRPDDPRVYNNLGSLRLMHGDAAGAIAHFEKAIDLEPHYVAARLNLAQTLLARGDARRASGHYLHALAVDGRVGDLQEQLALHVIRTLGPGDNERFLEDALRIRPGWPLLLNELAWIMATSPDAARRDPQRAVALALRAVELSGRRDPNMLDTLAAAYASRGEFEGATEVAGQALELARESGDATLAAAIESRRALYRQGQVYRADPASE